MGFLRVWERAQDHLDDGLLASPHGDPLEFCADNSDGLHPILYGHQVFLVGSVRQSLVQQHRVLHQNGHLSDPH